LRWWYPKLRTGFPVTREKTCNLKPENRKKILYGSR
jgi:hypothetical protein